MSVLSYFTWQVFWENILLQDFSQNIRAEIDNGPTCPSKFDTIVGRNVCRTGGNNRRVNCAR